ncbi:hypothetical protein [Paludibaculum fermentans]|uniref:hypothetical protein n=1 Tax=Paludibaculum fermentans TaxID=1473598 RepID=UPI003EBCF1B2
MRPLMRASVFIVLCGTRLAAFANEADDQEQPAEATVCQVVSNPSAYQGKLVHLTGRIEWDRDSFALAADQCDTALRTGGHQWLSRICLGASGRAEDPMKHSRELFYSAVRLYEAAIMSGEVRLIASFVGRIEARAAYSALPLGGGGFGLNGYCHMYQFPARLIYSGVPQWTFRYIPPSAAAAPPAVLREQGARVHP